MPHGASLLTLIKANILKEDMDGNDDEDWEYNNNKDNKNGGSLRDGPLDVGDVLMNAAHIDGGTL